MDMADIMLLEVPVEVRLELGAVVRLDNQHLGTGSWRSPHGALPSESGAGLAVGRISRPHRDSCIWLSICKRFGEKGRSVGRSGQRSLACHWLGATASNARQPLGSVRSCSWALSWFEKGARMS